MRNTAVFLLTVLLTILLGAPAPCSPEPPHPGGLTFLFGDNMNGTIEPCPSCGGGSSVGGLARRGGWVQRARGAPEGSLLLDSGDLFFDKYPRAISAEDVKALSEKASLILESYNLLGYDALGLGDDDLTLGKGFLVDLSRNATFPFLSSNLLDRETGEPLFQTHVFKETAGLRIAIFSLLSPHFLAGESDSRMRGIALRDPFEAARSILHTIRPEADLVVLLSHLGYAADIELAETVSGIDVIFGGHSDRSLSYPIWIGDTIIVRSGSKGLNVGKLRIQLASGRSSRPETSFEGAIPLGPSEKEHAGIAEMVKAFKMKHSPEWFKAEDVCPEE
jgi:2',3'-cyclic-nucleotide 2'-phosphodiesterase (5'-nucleotidase family)